MRGRSVKSMSKKEADTSGDHACRKENTPMPTIGTSSIESIVVNGQAFPALGATTLQNEASALGAHAFTKSVRLGALPVVGLVGSFHRSGTSRKCHGGTDCRSQVEVSKESVSPSVKSAEGGVRETKREEYATARRSSSRSFVSGERKNRKEAAFLAVRFEFKSSVTWSRPARARVGAADRWSVFARP